MLMYPTTYAQRAKLRRKRNPWLCEDVVIFFVVTVTEVNYLFSVSVSVLVTSLSVSKTLQQLNCTSRCYRRIGNCSFPFWLRLVTYNIEMDDLDDLLADLESSNGGPAAASAPVQTSAG